MKICRPIHSNKINTAVNFQISRVNSDQKIMATNRKMKKKKSTRCGASKQNNTKRITIFKNQTTFIAKIITKSKDINTTCTKNKAIKIIGNK